MPTRYFVRQGLGLNEDDPWTEVSEDEFVQAEQAAGFRPKPGCGPVATAGFGQTKMGYTREGKVTFDGSSLC